MNTDDYFKIFKIKKISDINRNELKRRYRILIQKYHPDKPITGNANKFKIIHAAYKYIQARMTEFLKEEDKKFFNPNFYFCNDGSVYDLRKKRWIKLKGDKGNFIKINV